MMRDRTELAHEYLRHDKKFPHVWCPGCGNGIVLGALIRAVDQAKMNKNDVVLVSGIGCSGRMSVYPDFNTLHTTHGRALAFATGIKLANPKLKVIVVMGDGDSLAIGGNHFIHAARRNIDLTAIIINNSIYGMTGGQYSPATPIGSMATTAPYRTIEESFDIAQLAITAGAAFVSRGTAYHAQMLHKLIYESLNQPGFGVVEILTHCHTQFGRRNNLKNAVDMMAWQRDNAVNIAKWKRLSPQEQACKVSIGILSENRESKTFRQRIDACEMLREAKASRSAPAKKSATAKKGEAAKIGAAAKKAKAAKKADPTAGKAEK